ncbi:VWA domain-containing protein [Acuticoccus sp. MNP-M23]|uniref:VWA domain-containing protein n=1 Tax=Acuticoccus sp. MNP-M23 TaxID=3072793 RepID=UPI002814DA68|nr:VWA domain-containing protein [Acuticoccus sp. MNP-M23]WMS42859.1 VWA domain-containing protein [Acuticoccus sp. MNP-M23]
MNKDNRTPTTAGTTGSSRREIDEFLARASTIAPAPAGGRGRLMFALDATMSRQPSWDKACAIQGEMFTEAGKVGGLDMQLVYFRGFGECRASKWISDGEKLGGLMSRIDCRGGRTQIGKVLVRALEETRKAPVQALVYIGDAMEENVDILCARAGELGLKRVPMFLFQERGDRAATSAFKEMARLTRGAHLSFDSSASAELARLLKAVAVYAAGGHKALADRSRGGDAGARLLLDKLS